MNRATAHHEAGHVVAVALLGEGLIRVHTNRVAAPVLTDRGSMTEPVLGLVESTVQVQLPMFAAMALKAYSKPPPASPGALRFPSVEGVYRGLWATAVNAVFVDGAGAAAEAKHKRRGLFSVWLGPHVRGDFQNAMNSLYLFIPDPEERRRAVTKIWNDTAALITSGAGWKAVRAVAEAISAADGRTLEGDVLEPILEAVLGPRDWLGSPIVDAVPMPPLGDLEALGDHAAAFEDWSRGIMG